MMFGTSCLIAVIMLVVWDAPVAAAVTVFAFFGFIDMVYLSANLNKVGPSNLGCSCWGPHFSWLYFDFLAQF